MTCRLRQAAIRKAAKSLWGAWWWQEVPVSLLLRLLLAAAAAAAQLPLAGVYVDHYSCDHGLSGSDFVLPALVAVDFVAGLCCKSGPRT